MFQGQRPVQLTYVAHNKIILESHLPVALDEFPSARMWLLFYVFRPEYHVYFVLRLNFEITR